MKNSARKRSAAEEADFYVRFGTDDLRVMREKLQHTANNSSLQEPMESTREGNCFPLV